MDRIQVSLIITQTSYYLSTNGFIEIKISKKEDYKFASKWFYLWALNEIIGVLKLDMKNNKITVALFHER